MKGVDPNVWLALASIVAAIVAGYFGLRAAGRTAQPNAQAAINAGFTALTERQVQEIAETRTALKTLQIAFAEQDKRLDDAEGRIEQMQGRETRYQRALRMLVAHVHALRVILSDAGQAVPEDPLTEAELADLLPPPAR